MIPDLGVPRPVGHLRRLAAETDVKPVATRAGMPAIRSSSAIAPEYCWQ